MLRFFNKRIHNRKGFTLIELIVVIAILGILALIAIPRFIGMRADANEGAVISNLRNIQTAAEVVAARENVAITSTTVTEAAISTALGIANFDALDDSPTGAQYSWNQTNGLATLSATPTVYPAGGVADFGDI